MVREGTPLQSIRYPNVVMIPTEGEDDEEIFCYGYVDLSSQSESDDKGSEEDCFSD